MDITWDKLCYILIILILRINNVSTAVYNTINSGYSITNSMFAFEFSQIMVGLTTEDLYFVATGNNASNIPNYWGFISRVNDLGRVWFKLYDIL